MLRTDKSEKPNFHKAGTGVEQRGAKAEAGGQGPWAGGLLLRVCGLGLEGDAPVCGLPDSETSNVLLNAGKLSLLP